MTKLAALRPRFSYNLGQLKYLLQNKPMDNQNFCLAIRCHICTVRQGIYKCPKCYRRSCSVKCIQLHKKRSRCDGQRDPTQPQPLSWLRTPAGIDHDYNFLSKIERTLDQNNKYLLEQGLLTEHELKGYDVVREDRDFKGNIERSFPSDIRKRLRALNISVRHVPKGLWRQRENDTTFSRFPRRAINWQIEWILVGITHHPALRDKQFPEANTCISHKAFDWKPLFRALSSSVDWYRTSLLTAEEKENEKEERAYKRRYRSRGAKRSRPRKPTIFNSDDPYKCLAVYQNAESGIWDTSYSLQQSAISKKWEEEIETCPSSLFDFYLHIPEWPSLQRKLLMRLRPGENLNTALAGRTVVEYPTVYVFPAGSPLPAGYEITKRERLIDCEQSTVETQVAEVGLQLITQEEDGGNNNDNDEEKDLDDDDCRIHDSDEGDIEIGYSDTSSSESEDKGSYADSGSEDGKIFMEETANTQKISGEKTRDNISGRGRGRDDRGRNQRGRGSRGGGNRSCHLDVIQSRGPFIQRQYLQCEDQDQSNKLSTQEMAVREGRYARRCQRNASRGGPRGRGGLSSRQNSSGRNGYSTSALQTIIPQKRTVELEAPGRQSTGSFAKKTRNVGVGLVSYDSDSD